MVTQNDNSARRVGKMMEFAPNPIPIYELRMKGKAPYAPERLITQAEYVIAKIWWDGLSDSSRVELGLCNEFQLQNALQDCKTYLVKHQDTLKAVGHLMTLLQEWGQLDIRGFPLVRALHESLLKGEMPEGGK